MPVHNGSVAVTLRIWERSQMRERIQHQEEGEIAMDRNKQKALEEAGFRVVYAEDLLELTEEERSIVELRVAVARTVRRLREQLHLSQQELAFMIRSSQSRVAKIEAAAKGVSLDLSFRGLFAVGGKIADLTAHPTKTASVPRSGPRTHPKGGKRLRETLRARTPGKG